MASLLAAHGNPVLSLGYFSEPGLPGQLRNIPLEYFRRAIDWLRRQPQVHGRRVVVAGESYGGEAALLIGATYPGLVSGVIALVPNDSVTGAPGDPNSAAWSRDGRPLAPGPISVQKIKGPIFAVGSVGDALWQSGFYVRDLKLRLQGHDPRPTILDFETAGRTVGSIIPNISTRDPSPDALWAARPRGHKGCRRAAPATKPGRRCSHGWSSSVSPLRQGTVKAGPTLSSCLTKDPAQHSTGHRWLCHGRGIFH